jgi:uncharacterized protein YdhG (YjbR/CyaY superfamily)
MQTVENYLENMTPPQKAEFERVRSIVKQLVPDAELVISYGMPTFKYQGRPLLHFGVFKDHMSIFPTGDSRVGEISELAAFHTSKGTLQFTEENPIPDAALEKLVAVRLEKVKE